METAPFIGHPEEAIDHYFLLKKALNKLDERGKYLGQVVFSRKLLKDESSTIKDSIRIGDREEYSHKRRPLKKKKDEIQIFKTSLSNSLANFYRSVPFSLSGTQFAESGHSSLENVYLLIKNKTTGEWIRAGYLKKLKLRTLMNYCDPVPGGITPDVAMKGVSFEKRNDELQFWINIKRKFPEFYQWNKFFIDIKPKLMETLDSPMDIVPYKLNEGTRGHV